jgi:hypothetical protein
VFIAALALAAACPFTIGLREWGGAVVRSWARAPHCSPTLENPEPRYTFEFFPLLAAAIALVCTRLQAVVVCGRAVPALGCGSAMPGSHDR